MVRGAADLVSPERQTHTCELWVEMHDQPYRIEWYEDVEGHRSGRWEKGRPGWQNLIKQLDRPDVEGVIVDSFDRAYRNVFEFLKFLNRIDELNKRFIAVKEGLDTTSILGKAIVTILMVIYQLESDQTSDRMTKMVKFKREELGRHWGPLPFACERDEEGKLSPTGKAYWVSPTGQAHNGEAAPGPGWQQRHYHEALRAAYDLYAAGDFSHDVVAEKLNLAGWRYYDRAGQPRPFNRFDIRRVIACWQTYRGDLTTGNQTNGKDQPIIKAAHPPILPVELCDQVGRVIGQRAKIYNKRSQKTFYLLSNVAFCAACGQKMAGYSQDGKRRYRHQSARQGCAEVWVLADAVEGELLHRLTELGRHEIINEIEAEMDALAREYFSRGRESAPLLKELQQQQERLTRLEDLYLDGEISRERYSQQKAGSQDKINSLQDQLYQMTQLPNLNRALDKVRNVLFQIGDAGPEKQKALINVLIERLELAGGAIVHLVPRPWAKDFFY